MFLASVVWVKTQQNIKVVWNNLQTTLPYTLTLTCFVYNENGQHQWKVPSKEENARNDLPETDWRDVLYDMLYLPVQKPSATTTISTAICCGTANTPPRVVWKRMRGFIRMHISRLDCRTNTSMKRRGCITICSGITNPRPDGLWIRIRLDWWVGKIYISLHWTYKDGTTLKGLAVPLLLLNWLC